jgi:hypothetical protein
VLRGADFSFYSVPPGVGGTSAGDGEGGSPFPGALRRTATAAKLWGDDAEQSEAGPEATSNTAAARAALAGPAAASLAADIDANAEGEAVPP